MTSAVEMVKQRRPEAEISADERQLGIHDQFLLRLRLMGSKGRREAVSITPARLLKYPRQHKREIMHLAANLKSQRVAEF